MRYELPEAVVAAIEAARGPTLVFDRARLAANFASVARAARSNGVTTLFAMKSFPRDEVIEIARGIFDGFDVASIDEMQRACDARAGSGSIVSIADPSGRAGSGEACDVEAKRLIVSCESVEQVARAPARAEIAIRVSASMGARDPAVGAVLAGDGAHRSRFGVDVDPARRAETIAAMVHAANGRPVGIHVHHGAVTATSAARFVTTVTDALASIGTISNNTGNVEVAGSIDAIRFINVGGAWHGIADLDGAFAALRAAIPAHIEIIVEPGRALVRDAGFATGAITATRRLDDRRIVVTELSRICHLRWSPVELVARPPAAGDGEPLLVVGPTCFEEDTLGEWIVSAIPDRVIVRDVTGYAVAWNTGFAGVPPATITFA